MSEHTRGIFTTGKLQALLEMKLVADISSRARLAEALRAVGEQISVHGIDAWFKHTDSNYALQRDSLDPTRPTYPLPRRRWNALLDLFGLQPEDLTHSDREFRRFCSAETRRRRQQQPTTFTLVCVCAAADLAVARADAALLAAEQMSVRVISEDTDHSDWAAMRQLTTADGVVLYATEHSNDSTFFEEALNYCSNAAKATLIVLAGGSAPTYGAFAILDRQRLGDSLGREVMASLRRQPAAPTGESIAAEANWQAPNLYTARPSIAVLPFANFTGQPEHEELAEALAEDINLHLSRLPELFVVSNSSTRHYRHALPDSRQVSDELGVRYVLEGSIRAGASGAVRVTAQLVDAVNRRGMWSKRFERDASELKAIDDDLAVAICAQLEPRIRLSEIQEHAGHEQAPAWRAWQEGWYRLFVDAPDPVPARSLECFEQALAVDPDYPLAHAGMAIGLATGVLWGGLPIGATEEAKRHARIAYRQLPEDSAVLYAMGMISFVTGESLETTLGYLRDAASLEPSNPMYQAILGYLLAHQGDTDEGLKRCHYAMRLSPRDSREPFLCYMLGSAHIAAREYEQAVQVMRRSARFSEVDFVWLMLAYAYEHLGDRRELYACLKRVANGGRVALMQWSMKNNLWLGHTLEEKAGMLELLAELERP